MNELIPLVGGIALAVVLCRAFWRWWNTQPPGIAGLALLVASGTAGLGWILVGLVLASRHISSENFIWLLVGPLLLIGGMLVVCAGVVGTLFSVIAVVTAVQRAPAHRTLIAIGGVALALLNLAHIGTLVRFLYTG